MGGHCTEIAQFPNATIAEYGTIEGDVDAIMAEIFARGPVAACVNAEPIHNYGGGVFDDDSFSKATNHIVSIVGWGTDQETGKKHWHIRNSWGKEKGFMHVCVLCACANETDQQNPGQYWGEMGYMRLEMGKNLLGIEGAIAWATPGTFTVENFPCSEDGKNCNSKTYVDPSKNVEAIQRRLAHSS